MSRHSSDVSDGQASSPSQGVGEDALNHYEESYPVFTSVLARYYPDDELTFFTDYTRKGGETALEFDGLNAELKRLVKSPRDARGIINGYFSLELSSSDVKEMLVDLYDRLNGTGDYDEALQAKETQQRAKVSPDYLFNSYANQRFQLPARLKGHLPTFPQWMGKHAQEMSGTPLAGLPLPLWVVFLFGLALAGAFGALGAFVPLPVWIAWLPLLLSLIGLALALASGWLMQTKRRSVLHPKIETDDEEEEEEEEHTRTGKKRKGLFARLRRAAD